jgi:ribosome biogenesis protein SSF1/2
LIFSRSTTAKKSINFKITRSQTKGPTLCFNVLKYSLIKDVLKKNTFLVNNSIKDYATCPVVVLNNFGGMENQIKLMSVMFQGMFPPINVQQVTDEFKHPKTNNLLTM